MYIKLNVIAPMHRDVPRGVYDEAILKINPGIFQVGLLLPKHRDVPQEPNRECHFDPETSGEKS